MSYNKYKLTNSMKISKKNNQSKQRKQRKQRKQNNLPQKR